MGGSTPQELPKQNKSGKKDELNKNKISDLVERAKENFLKENINKYKKKFKQELDKKAYTYAAEVAIGTTAEILGLPYVVPIGKAAVAAYKTYRETNDGSKAIDAGLKEGAIAMISDSSVSGILNLAGIQTEDVLTIIMKNALSEALEELIKYKIKEE